MALYGVVFLATLRRLSGKIASGRLQTLLAGHFMNFPSRLAKFGNRLFLRVMTAALSVAVGKI
jgi:hypothetical protein